MPDGLFKGVEHELGGHGGRDLPAHDPAGEHINDKRHIDHAIPGLDIGEVRDPELVGSLGPELPVDPVIGTGTRRIRTGRDDLPAPDHPLQAHLPHQALDSAARDLPSFTLQAVPDFARTINTTVVVPDPTDMRHQIPITSGTYAGPGRIFCYGRLMIKRGRGNRQHATDWLDPIIGTTGFNKCDHLRNGRSSATCAK
ncbi:hypothetical protein MSKU15_3562 [Komagataeibacter diospyri]|nr:hypothetical protein MSKU15_3562 [Komagataeibacter diospyri]